MYELDKSISSCILSVCHLRDKTLAFFLALKDLLRSIVSGRVVLEEKSGLDKNSESEQIVSSFHQADHDFVLRKEILITIVPTVQ